MTISERNGELANLMMNIVYEKYDEDNGQTRQTVSQTLAEPVKYHEVAKRMWDCVLKIKDSSVPRNERAAAANTLREDLVRSALDKNLDELTSIYKDKTSDAIIGYDPVAVSSFIANSRQTESRPCRRV